MAFWLKRFVKFAWFVEFLKLLGRFRLQFSMVQSFSESPSVCIGHIRIWACHSRLSHFPWAATFDGLFTEVSLQVFHRYFYLIAFGAFQAIVNEGGALRRFLLRHDRVDCLLLFNARAVVMSFEGRPEARPRLFINQVLPVAAAVNRWALSVVIATTSDNIVLLESFLRLYRSFSINRVAFKGCKIKWFNYSSHWGSVLFTIVSKQRVCVFERQVWLTVLVILMVGIRGQKFAW